MTKQNEFFGFELTNQLIEICNDWLKYKGYNDIEAYGESEVLPLEDDSFKVTYYEGSVGYEPYYLYENLYYKHLKEFTITRECLLDFYFNSGDDDIQKSMRIEIGNEVINAILKGEIYIPLTAEEILENIGYIDMSYCEEIDDDHPLANYEDIDLDFPIEIKLQK